MPGRTSGLERDLNLVRRRAWLFIPFLVLGILVALAFGSFAGDSNAVANMTLDTVVQDVVAGGDRGLRIFEAQAMTHDERFKAEVIAEIGDPNFDMSRFAVSLAPISVADGVSRGILTVTILDPDKVKAEKYRAAFVSVYAREFTGEDGLFRKRFIESRTNVANNSETAYLAAYQRMRALADPKGINVDPLVEITGATTAAGYMYDQRAQLNTKLAELDGAITALNGASPGVAAAVVSSVLGQPVSGADAPAALAAQRAATLAALIAINAQITTVADGRLDPALRAAIDETAGFREVKTQSFIRLANSQVAVDSAESTIETSYTFSGGLSGSVLGRIAVAVAVTVVFGLIAIYTVEWLSQLRDRPQD
jgi:hypothetical protein